MVRTMGIVALLAIASSPLLANPPRAIMSGTQATGPTMPVTKATEPASPVWQATASALTTPQTPEPLYYIHTYYVSPRGNDANPGTPTAPLRHIQAGINKANAGDRVMAMPGTYNEQLTFPRSGTATSPITVTGAVDRAGNPLAVIDNTAPVPAEWVAAPEVGNGVYKQVGYTPDLLLYRGAQIFRLHPARMAGLADRFCDAGFDVLRYPADTTWNPQGQTPAVSFWDNVQVIFGTLNSDTTYIRFRNGDDPDTCALLEVGGTAFKLGNDSFITIAHFKIQGTSFPVTITGGGHNIIQGNVIRHGWSAIALYGGTAFNTISGNDITLGYGDYGHFGEWESGPDSLGQNCASYVILKFFEGVASSKHMHIGVYECGPGNTILNNTIHRGDVAIAVQQTKNLVIAGNTITGMPSVAIDILPNSESLYIYDNKIEHCHLMFRMNQTGKNGDMTRGGFIWNNRCYNYAGAGHHVFFNILAGYEDALKAGRCMPPDFWVYHNSFAGGYGAISPGIGIVARMKFLDNIFSARTLVCNERVQEDTASNLFAIFDYNFCGGTYNPRGIRYAKTDGHNFFSDDTIYGDINHQVWPLGSEPDWIVPDTSQAYESGLDLSDSFTMRGIEYGPLPGMTHGYFPGAKPNLGAVQDQAHMGGQQGDHGSVTQLPELAFAPNPANGRYVTIRCAIPTREIGKLTLRDVLGRNVKNIAPVASGITQLDLRGLAPGVYVATLDAGSQSVTRKLTITAH
jgi:hypothetical protein